VEGEVENMVMMGKNKSNVMLQEMKTKQIKWR
jgi:hypothetical protein